MNGLIKVLPVILFVLILKAAGAVGFTGLKWHPDLCLSVPVFQNSESEPIDLPRTVSYFVQASDGGSRVEDRFNTFDLWKALSIRACWRDSFTNRIVIARITAPAPAEEEIGVRTRRGFYADLPELNPKDKAALDDAVICCAPYEAGVGYGEKPRRGQRKNLAELYIHPSTNERFLVYSFRPRSPEHNEKPDWYMVSFEVAPGRDIEDEKERFESEFMDEIFVPSKRERNPEEFIKWNSSHLPDECELFLSDLRRSVANYPEWRCTSQKDVVVLDELGGGTRELFLTSFTNSIPKVRRKYAELVPSPLAATNHLAVVRAFRDREHYLDYVGHDKNWTAALWSPEHRELVICLADSNTDELLKTARHELFHQYLSYAAALAETAAWFNEGHAELFANSHFDKDGNIVFDTPDDKTDYIRRNIEMLAKILPFMFDMDYQTFYDGETIEEVRAKYILAWSMAYFLEVGAPDMRFDPFKNLRGDYVKKLVETRSAKDSSRAVFTPEVRNLFIYEWTRFWNKL